MTNGEAHVGLLKRNGLLAVAVAALAACTMAPVASAASWSPVGTTHTLDATNVTLDINFNGVWITGTTCTESSLHAEVESSARVTVTGASFTGCRASGQATGCTATADAVNLPWVVTAPSTTDVRIDNFRLNLTFATTGSDYCFFHTAPAITMTGALNGGTWNQAQHQVTWTRKLLTSDFPAVGTAFPSTVSAAYRDTAQTLSLSD